MVHLHVMLLTGSSLEMQHGSHSSVFQLLKEKSSGRLWNWMEAWRHELESVYPIGLKPSVDSLADGRWMLEDNITFAG